MSNDNFASANLTAGQLNALVKKMGGEDIALAFLRGEYVLSQVAQAVKKLLTQVGSLITVLPSTENFIAAEKLKINTSPSAELKICFFGYNFKSWFLGKVEESFAGSQLKIQKMSQNSVDHLILNELGSEEKAETTLCEMFEFLKTADQNLFYLFYIKDVGGRLRAVYALRRDGGWCLSAFVLSSHCNADFHVVSRNFDPVLVST
jgi:hypothetical protein